MSLDMKILHLLDSLKPGGAENVALNYSKALKKLGVESVIIGSKEDISYEKALGKTACIKHDFDKSMLMESNILIVHCNQWLPRLLKYIHIIKKNKVRIF